MKISFDARDEVIVITGGAQGIGRSLAIAAAGVGATVIVCDVADAHGSALADGSNRIHYRHLDVANRDDVFRVVRSLEKEFGAIDGMVLGAAVQPRVPLAKIEPADWISVIDVNVNGVLWPYQAAIDGMIKRGKGSIVAFTSGLAATGWPESAPYASSKAALVAMVKSAAKEVAKHGVRFNLISPGVIDTAQYRSANAGDDHDHWKGTLGVGKPEDVVGSLMFLLSDAASITASVLSRDYAFPAIVDYTSGDD